MKYLITIICLFTYQAGFSQESCSPKKREIKEIHKLFGSEISTETLTIPANRSSSGGNLKEGDCIYIVKREGALLGYLLSTRAKGRFDYFDYSVIYSSDLTVSRIIVLVYRSTQGEGICQKKWLNQFQGYTSGELKLGQEIDAISGSTVSATSMVADIQRCQRLMNSLREAYIIQ